MKRISIIVLISLCFLFFLNSSVIADNQHQFDDAKLDNFISSQMQKHGLPGVAVAVTKGDAIVYEKAFGFATKGQPMTTNTPMYIGSLTKSFTSLAIMQLHEAGKLNIDEPVINYLPAFKIADKEAEKTITVRNLLNHASGLSDFSYLPKHADSVSTQDSIIYLSNAEPTAEIGTTFQYFNTNYAVLGAIIENVSGIPYSDYVERNIFAPLQMNDSFANQVDATTAGLPKGYTSYFGFSLEREQPFRVHDLPAGYLMMSINDLSKYLRAQLHGGELEGASILGKEWIDLMHTPQEGLDVPYGAGWFIYDDFGTKFIEHGGTNENFHTSGILLPEHDMTIAILVNKNSILHAMFGNPELTDGIKCIVLGLPIPKAVISIRWIGYLMLAGFMISILMNIRAFFRYDKWYVKFCSKNFFGKLWDIGSQFLIPLMLIFVVPLIVKIILHRGFTWRAGWAQAPDVMTWLWSGVIFDLTHGIGKVNRLIKNKKS